MTTRTDAHPNGGGTVLIIAPFWRQAKHVGNYRVDRYVRWLTDGGYRVVIVRAGLEDKIEMTDAGHEITIRDPLTLYPDARTLPTRLRKPNKLRRFLAHLVLNPDPSIVWARRVAAHPLVAEYAVDSVCVLSSAPPDSAHIAAARIAKRFGGSFIADMRDGWLDEPLKPLLRKYRFQRIREGRIEKRILSRADRIVVTSDVWKELLGGRLAFTKDKTVVVTNGYPAIGDGVTDAQPRTTTDERQIRLVYAGRFTDSRPTRKPSYLLATLARAIEQFGHPGSVTLLGDLNASDRKEVEGWMVRFEKNGWTLKVLPSLPRDKMMENLGQADGLLMLTVMTGTIPAKLFEYIVVKKPVLAVTTNRSAVWRMGESVPQLFAADYESSSQAREVAVRFLEACRTGVCPVAAPEVFSEAHLKRVFLDKVMNVCDSGERAER